MAASSSSSSSGAFLDLNVPYTRGSTSRHAISALLTTAADFGYSGIALNQTVTGVRKIQPLQRGDTQFAEEVAHGVKQPLGTEVEIYHRLTVQCDDAKAVKELSTRRDDLRTYDLVSIIPGSDDALNAAVDCDVADIIAMENGGAAKQSFYLRSSHIDSLCKSKKLIEVCYHFTLRSSALCSAFLTNMASVQKAVGRASNLRSILLISSGSGNEMLLRAPHEVSAIISPCLTDRSIVLNCQSVTPRRALALAKRSNEAAPGVEVLKK